jgi:hypothetical protein
MNINDITYAINGAVFEVNRVLGPGFLEKVYENALLFELRKRGLKVESQAPIKVFYKEEVVGEYVADILSDTQELRSKGWFKICPKGMTINSWPGRPAIFLRQSACVCGSKGIY